MISGQPFLEIAERERTKTSPLGTSHRVLMKKITRRICDHLWKEARDEQILAIEEFLDLDKRNLKNRI